jgi:ABC-type Mn2+/Zn2+ transport system permease subunit
MEALREILATDFLLRDALYTVVLVGFACPLVGVFFILRRLVFLGVALPQISSTGVALALSLHVWFGEHSHGHHHTSTAVAFSGALVFSMLTVLALTFLERRRQGIAEGWLGTAFVVATAFSLLLIAKCPEAEQGWLNLFRGEVIAITRNELNWTGGILAVVLVMLAIFRREFLLVSYDWRLAATLGKSVFGWDLLLFSLIGLTVAATVMTVGPLIAFGFLVVPTLIAQVFASSMPRLLALSSLIGGLTAFAGFYIAYRWDLPVGPAAVGLLGIMFISAQLLGCLLRRLTHDAQDQQRSNKIA